jgi:hypothetical protein
MGTELRLASQVRLFLAVVARHKRAVIRQVA